MFYNSPDTVYFINTDYVFNYLLHNRREAATVDALIIEELDKVAAVYSGYENPLTPTGQAIGPQRIQFMQGEKTLDKILS